MTTKFKRLSGKNHVWRCNACGKISQDLVGERGYHDYGWDVSCAMNAGRIEISSLEDSLRRKLNDRSS